MRSDAASQIRRLLVTYSNASTFVPTTYEYLEAFSKFSKWEVSYAHVTHGIQLGFDLSEFDAVFHSYCARLCFEGFVSASYIAALKKFRGVKVLAVQDEYDRTDVLRRSILDIGFHIVLTCVPQKSIEYVYPKRMFAGVEFITVLTGYVAENLRSRVLRRIPLEARPTVLGYRGRALGGRYGRLGFEKFEIGRRMREICANRGISHDIEMSEDKRLYGETWYEFIQSCHAILGSESGSNVFDFDGSLEERCNELKSRGGGAVSYEMLRKLTDPLEEHIDMGQVSPRIFEAAALWTPLVLLSGRYSGVVAPGEHYIELKKDFSNVDAVLGQLDDVAALEAMATRAYDHLVASGQYSYRRFVEQIEHIIERKHVELDLKIGSFKRAGFSERHPSALWSARLSELLVEIPTARPRDFAYYCFVQRTQQYEAIAASYARVESIYAQVASAAARLPWPLPRIFRSIRDRLKLRQDQARL